MCGLSAFGYVGRKGRRSPRASRGGRGDTTTGIDEREDAERTALVVVEELCNRLTKDEVYHLLSQLPARLKSAIYVMPSPEPASTDAFVDAVARRLGIPADEARTRVGAVFATMRRAVSKGQFEDVFSELDPECADLLS